MIASSNSPSGQRAAQSIFPVFDCATPVPGGPASLSEPEQLPCEVGSGLICRTEKVYGQASLCFCAGAKNGFSPRHTLLST